ncbi:50S ribosomal protein L16 [Candidatus Vidania fulgoroideae]|uniref:50S ribosomal protein L16 n=1 Tax=Candidatus Vidania fulgoroideorum TaxID=881286 RepID=A0AAX3N8K6_9PROT|nr:50S ribosomal protein L16 [Candidatus Vidania fulgoroideae]WDR79457.1 50S ribosomal protein L16 [Candidatus Vidania fulgoroideae]
MSKFLKFRKGRNKGLSYSGSKVIFYKYGIKSLTRGFLNKKQIESARIVLSKIIKKNGKIMIRVYPDFPKTKKPIEVRMGNGKGEIFDYYYRVKPGKILFELDCNEKIAKKAIKLSSFKLPLKVILEKRL